MFESIKENWNEISGVLNDKKVLHRLTWTNLHNIVALVDFLKKFEVTFKVLQQTGGSVYECFPYYINIKNHCETAANDGVMITEIKRECHKLHEEKWKPNISKYHYCSTFLFLPCKRLHVLSAEERDNIK